MTTRAPAATALSTVQWTNARAALVDNADVAVSTRASATAVAALPNATDYTSARAAKLDHLDVDASTRAPASTAVSNADYTSARAVKIDDLDATVSSRASATSLATVQTGIGDLQTRVPAALDGAGNIKAGVQTLASGVITSIINGIFDFVLEPGAPAKAQTFAQQLRISWSILAARALGLAISATGNETFMDAANSKPRASYALSTDGTRTPGTFDGDL